MTTSLQTPPDGGMLYTETNLEHFIAEPWNMISSALFLIPGIYWLIKLKGFSKDYAFLSVAVYLMLAGCIGSTVYHGLRRWAFFLYLDWVPIAILCLAASVYFWIQYTGKWFYGVLALLLFMAIEFFVRPGRTGFSPQVAVSINYAVMVLMILLPLFLVIIKTKGYSWQTVALALLAFVAAISFRVYDAFAPWAIGTHFLWHTFGMLATALMFIYLYQLRNLTLTAEHR
jgi:hypothetical protein